MSQFDDEELRSLMPLIYDELRRLARRQLQRERADHTLQTTDLVHEAYLRLAKQDGFHFKNGAHILGVCAQLMRQILVDYARRRAAAKRDGGYKVTFDDAELRLKKRNVDLIALDDALNSLARLDPRQSRIVEMRCFGGLTIEETARGLNLSPTTVKREWTTALLWLRHEMRSR